ncbi:MAG TPA: hypothetical protein VG826_06050 [Pirellulales bacterium]|nr:hypothetical protein [Pirellulales bacterium]
MPPQIPGWALAALRLVAAALAITAVWLLRYAHYHRWEDPPEMVAMRPDWANRPVKLDHDRIDVVTKLIAEDRQEIRFYQDKLFTISFFFTAGVLGIAGFWLKLENDNVWLRLGLAALCLVFCGYYFRFVRFANEAIAINDHDLIGLQFAVGLAQPGEYLEERAIYPEPAQDPETGRHRLTGHPHFRPLVMFNSWLVAGAVFLFLFLPLGEGRRHE